MPPKHVPGALRVGPTDPVVRTPGRRPPLLPLHSFAPSALHPVPRALGAKECAAYPPWHPSFLPLACLALPTQPQLVGTRAPRGELRRALVAQPAVRPVVVVLLAPAVGQHPGFQRAAELLPVQQLIPQP